MKDIMKSLLALFRPGAKTEAARTALFEPPRLKDFEEERLRGRIVTILAQEHLGEENPIDMGDLYRRVFDKEYRHKINDTRPLRKLITALRFDGYRIGDCSGGYYWMRSATEVKTWAERRRQKTMRELYMQSRMLRLNMPELLEQMKLNLRASDGS